MLIMILALLCLTIIVIKGERYKLMSLYIGIILIIQALYNGCPIVDLQNWILKQYSSGYLVNGFLGEGLGNLLIVRFITMLIGFYFIYPTIKIIWNKCKKIYNNFEQNNKE